MPYYLTPREYEILSLVAEGQTVYNISTKLFISVKTVKDHKTNLIGKLGVRNSVQAIALYNRGLIKQSVNRNSTVKKHLAEINQLVDQGFSVAEIAKKFKKTINLIEGAIAYSNSCSLPYLRKII